LFQKLLEGDEVTPRAKIIRKKNNSITRTINMKIPLGKAACAIVVALVASSAYAIVPPTESDQVIYVPGGINQIIPEVPGQTEAPLILGQVPFPDQAIALTEPGVAPAPPYGLNAVSDWVWVQSGELYFESDSDTGQGFTNFPAATIGPANTQFVPESGQLQDLGVLLQGGTPLPPGYLQVLSDITEVPEPSALALLAVGGITIGKMLRRKISLVASVN
jgi:hypothetical protein